MYASTYLVSNINKFFSFPRIINMWEQWINELTVKYTTLRRVGLLLRFALVACTVDRKPSNHEPTTLRMPPVRRTGCCCCNLPQRYVINQCSAVRGDVAPDLLCVFSSSTIYFLKFVFLRAWSNWFLPSEELRHLLHFSLQHQKHYKKSV